MAMRPNFWRMEFHLEVDSDWPPFSAETLWVEMIDDHRFRIDNSPFFVRNIAVDDLVDGVDSGEGPIQFVKKISSGGHSTIWVITLNDVIKQTLKEDVMQLGCDYEGSPWPSLISIDVPSRTLLDRLHQRLGELRLSNDISFVDACIAT
jgi:hypothetical protein